MTVCPCCGAELLTAETIAAERGIAVRTWHAYVQRGYAPPADVHIGRTPVWTRATLTAWQAARR